MSTPGSTVAAQPVLTNAGGYESPAVVRSEPPGQAAIGGSRNPVGCGSFSLKFAVEDNSGGPAMPFG